MPMFDSDYSLAWTLYGIAALGCLLFWFRVTRWMWRWLREPLRLIVAVLLFTPTIVDPAKELFAPAVAITAMDLAFKVGNNAWRAVADLAMYGLIAFALYLLLVAIRWPIERKYGRRAENHAADEDSRTLRERMEDQDDDDYARDYAPSRGRMRTEPRL
ncbi:MFS transporter [Stutzerimonas stutzeri]|nr:MFS transporter [Stutzerimonas stutzeri]